MYRKHINFFLMLFKKAVKKQKNFVIVKKTSYIIFILNILEQYGLIYFFQDNLKNVKIVFNKPFIIGFPVIGDIDFFLKDVPIYLNHGSMLNLTQKYPSSIFLISTNKGLVCHRKALQFKVFGKLIAVVHPS